MTLGKVIFILCGADVIGMNDCEDLCSLTMKKVIEKNLPLFKPGASSLEKGEAGEARIASPSFREESQ
jgi:hypothetical protein